MANPAGKARLRQVRGTVMKLEKIIPAGKGRFVFRYDLQYRLKNKGVKQYEMVSRVPLENEQTLSDSKPEGVVLIVLNQDSTRVLLNLEFRPAVAKQVYNFPAGLIDPGETPQQAAVRELWEETGLHLTRQLAMYGRSYGAVGLSNESSVVCVAQADDRVPFGGNHDPMEEITPVWVSKQQAADIIQNGAVTARVQLFLAMWTDPIFEKSDEASACGAGAPVKTGNT